MSTVFHIRTILTCDHVLLFRAMTPQKGEQLYCPNCQVRRAVKNVEGIWKWKCSVCHAARSYGVVPGRADTAASLHANTWSHKVELWREGDAESSREILPHSGSEEIPF